MRTVNRKLNNSNAYLSVGENTDDAGVLLHPLQLGLDVLLALIGTELLSVLNESFFAGLGPAPVEPSPHLIAQMLCPDGVQRAQTARSLDVTNKTNNDHRWGLDDSHGLASFLLVQLCGENLG